MLPGGICVLRFAFCGLAVAMNSYTANHCLSRVINHVINYKLQSTQSTKQVTLTLNSLDSRRGRGFLLTFEFGGGGGHKLSINHKPLPLSCNCATQLLFQLSESDGAVATAAGSEQQVEVETVNQF